MADPIQTEYRQLMNDLAGGLDDIFNGPKLPGLPHKSKVGFVLLSFEFGKLDGGRVNYISNGAREDMIAAMKEWIARAEGRAIDPTSKARQ